MRDPVTVPPSVLHVVERPADAPSDHRRILRIREVAVRVGLGVSTVKKYVALGTFPKPVHITPRAIGWYTDEVDAWLAARTRVA